MNMTAAVKIRLYTRCVTNLMNMKKECDKPHEYQKEGLEQHSLVLALTEYDLNFEQLFFNFVAFGTSLNHSA